MKKLYLLICVVMLSCNDVTKQKVAFENLYEYDVEERIASLGITLQEMKLPPGLSIELAVKKGDLIYLSGNGPKLPNGEQIAGKVSEDLTVEEGYEAARLTAINHLSVLKSEIGDLNKVVRVIKVFGMVNSPSTFTEHPKVINGYSDLMIEVFGERGKHARSAVGMNSLPWNLACEVEAIIQIQESPQ